MLKIHQLDPEIIAKIAAGEVIERPVYALKELIDNAIDAKANWIKIDIEQSGLKKISILDNGEGMLQEDLLESFKMHTTSKILLADDLHRIKTLGFRGEALSSIAAISNLTIQSKTPNQTAGYEVQLSGGNLEKHGPIGIPTGTKIVVEDLFFSVPARKKYLKSTTLEWHAILEMIEQFALAFPDKRFTLSHNKKLIFDISPNQSIQARVEKILGETLSRQLISFDFDENYLHISGFLAHPHTATTYQTKQIIFINKRRVSDKLITQAIKEALSGLLPSNLNPAFVLFLELPFEMVDVNVHPRKEQVSFINSQFIFDVIKKAVLKTLLVNNLTTNPYSNRKNSTSFFTGEFLKDKISPWSIIESESDSESFNFLQLNNLYLILKSNKGLHIFDQHASHERILYEQFLIEFSNKKNNKKYVKLKKPFILELSQLDSQILRENFLSLKKTGFEIEEILSGQFSVTALPLLFKDRDISSLILELIEIIKSTDNKNRIDTLSEQIIKFIACKTAIKSGDRITSEQAKRLIKKLEATANNSTCPHGRPTNYFLSTADLDKHFKR